MPKMQQYTPEFKDQAVRFVFESIEPDESRKEACRRLASKVNVKEVTLYNWVKAASPVTSNSPGRGGQPDTINDLRAQISGLKKENRELVRANEILKAASAFSGRSSTANQRGDRVRCRFSRHVWSRADLPGVAGRQQRSACLSWAADFGPRDR